MTFVQPEFLLFFAAVWALYWLGGHRLQNLVLLVSGGVFYGFVHPWFLLPLLISSVTDFAAALAMERRPARKRTWLALSLVVNLGMLGWFKYAGWMVENVDAVLGLVGLGGVGPLSILLPVGISFYTFQSLSYTLDVYRGRFAARTSLRDFLVFVSFFPQLVAGPIERASRLLPQVEQRRVFSWTEQREGLALALWGATKKMAIADNLAPWVDRIHAHPDPSFSMVWAASLAFSVQLLCDFSGYTDIARGTGRMLGFQLSENFRWPYLATTPMDAWSRFHITLTSWLTEYVYMPLASSQWIHRLKPPFIRVGGMWHVARVTVITFVLSGLWHGAAWHFVLWGLYLGLLQTAYMIVLRRVPGPMRKDRRWSVLTVPLMFFFQLIAQLLFRTPTVERLVHHLTQVPGQGTQGELIVAASTLGVTLFFAVPLIGVMLYDLYVLPRVRERAWYPVVQMGACGAYASAIVVLGRPDAADFIYFQF